jgi:HlyD family secretion protein
MGTRWLTVLLVAALAGAGGYYYWQQRATGQLDVQTVALTRGDVRRVVSTTGAVNALVTVDVGSQLSGKIGELNVDFSSPVKHGQVLARIEPFTFESAVREQEAGVAIAEANIALQQAGVERADANLHKAELDLHRSQELVVKGATSQSAVDTALAAQLSAKADLATANAQVDNAKATVAQRHATLDSARIDLDRTFIRSPIDGVVIDRAVETGQTVAASMTAPKLFTIAEDLSHVQILAQVDEADIGQVTSANPVSFTVDAYPDVKFDGKVEQIRLAPVSLQNVVTYTVVIAAENPQGRLLPGMTANVEIVTGEHVQVVVVPNEALRFQPVGPAAALVRDPGQTGAVQVAPGDRSARLLDKLKTGLGLSDADLDKVRAGLEAEFTAIKNAGPPGAAPSEGDAREQARMRIAKVLRAVLTPEQYQKYQEMQKQRPTGSRKATLWTHEAGALVPHEVRLGLADANTTEVEDGLSDGVNVVVRVRETVP